MDSVDTTSLPPAAPTPTERPRRRRFSARRLALAALIILLVLLLCAAAYALKYGFSASPPPMAGPTGLRLHSISMISPEEGWIAGDKPRSHPNTNGYGSVDQNAVEPVILHYKGGRWTEDKLPSNMNPYNVDMSLYHIAMASATEGWATGSTLLPYYPPVTFNGSTVSTIVDGITFPVLLHYSGGVWRVVENPPVTFGDISLRGASNGWAIGSVVGTNGFGRVSILHYDGHTWTPMSDPPASFSFSPSRILVGTDHDLWVSGIDSSVQVGDGEDGNEHTALLHYDGKRWSKVDPHIANGRLYSFALVSPNEGWAVGMQPDTDQHKPSEVDGLLLHYHNGVWEKPLLVKDPLGQRFFSLSSVAMASPLEGWAVGQEGFMLHYANGVWKQAQSITHENLTSITFVSASEGWAIGDHSSILHYQGGKWSLYQR